jgi:AAA+ ATPase superfamily predicted ATPase
VRIGEPVTGKDFFNRSQEINLILRRVQDLKIGRKRNLAVIGLRKTGKTSLVKEVLGKIKDESVIPVYVYIYETSAKSIASNLLESILFALLSKDKKIVEKDCGLEELKILTFESYPKIARIIEQIAIELDREKPDFVKLFKLCFNLSERIAQEYNRFVVVALDEFQRLQIFCPKGTLDVFRECISKQDRTLFILAGSAITLMEQILTAGSKPLFNQVEILSLNPFDYTTARMFLKEVVDLPLKEDQKAFLVSITNGMPFYLAVIGYRIRDMCLDVGVKSPSTNIIISALNKELFSSTGSLYTYVDGCISEALGKKGVHYTEILRHIAMGKTQSQIAKAISRPLKDMHYAIRRFIELDLIEKRDNILCFKDPIIELWFKYVYSLKIEKAYLDLETKNNQFKSKMEEMIAAFKQELGKGNEARVRELFRMFDGKTKINGKKLPKFADVQRVVIMGEEFDILARINKAYWAVEVKDKIVSPAIVNKFIKKLKKACKMQPIEEKLLVCLEGIDEKARRIAEKENIWIWEIEKVNYLMRTYRQFPIIL